MHVNIKYVNFPQPGKKMGRLQLDNGQVVWVPPNLLNLFRAGMSCEIGTADQMWGDRPVVVATTGPQQHGQGSQGGYQQGGSYPGRSAGTYAQRPNTGFQPRVVQGGGQPRTPDTEKHIFVTGIVGRAMGSGKFAASEIAVLTQAAVQAFEIMQKPPVRQSLPPEPQADPQPDMPEEPPFPDGEPA